MAILGRCSDPECGGDTVDYVCPECQHREIERLRAIVDKLPKTADGVPVVPGMVLWYRSPAGIIPTEQLHNWADVASCLDDRGCVFYSTREAAKAEGK